MRGTWTFGRTMAVGFAAVVLLNALGAGIALQGLRNVVERKDRVIDTDSRLVLQVQKLLTIRDARASANRGYLISGKQSFLDQQYAYDTAFDQQIAEIRRGVDTPRAVALVASVAALQHEFVLLDREPVRLRRAGAPMAAVSAAWLRIGAQRSTTAGSMDELFRYQQGLVTARQRAAGRTATGDIRLIVVVLVVSVLASVVLALVLVRRLRERIGTTVSEVESSSAELQTTANQQAVGAREQAVAVSEISTTVTELLVTSRQIADSARKVSEVAAQTTRAGLSGGGTVLAARESMTEIRRQVDAVVRHMEDLGDKSQRIGTILDIVSELAEQTNILSINATIEAVGAGEPGRRFVVVADEIRVLADRVSDSAKEIRDLIDGMRGAVTTSMTATAIGSRAVDAGTAQVGEVAVSFDQIAELVRTTTESAREIELSTRQQATAVEQVTIAVTNVADAARETETTSKLTLRTAAELSRSSTKLRELIAADG
jgi:methyl-accepting chemotaxis protein